MRRRPGRGADHPVHPANHKSPRGASRTAGALSFSIRICRLDPAHSRGDPRLQRSDRHGRRQGAGRYPSAPTFSGGAFVIFPDEMHDVHTRTRRRTPFASTIFTGCRFGNHLRRVLLWAWLTLFPVEGPLPHT